ncbi:hypothetical protein [Ferrimonas balearica]|uniref:hypothetical protein n=1 Tax=Ferrimonas balearica TaxID=44012 RepID=UPI001C99DAC0|nr:hypothetical protein [Ferrimonas balearica]MBY5990994.1 hypothetical protein [Ferrimonas balearica]
MDWRDVVLFLSLGLALYATWKVRQLSQGPEHSPSVSENGDQSFTPFSSPSTLHASHEVVGARYLDGPSGRRLKIWNQSHDPIEQLTLTLPADQRWFDPGVLADTFPLETLAQFESVELAVREDHPDEARPPITLSWVGEGGPQEVILRPSVLRG